jgi:hypothetical protein
VVVMGEALVVSGVKPTLPNQNCAKRAEVAPERQEGEISIAPCDKTYP